MSKEDNVVEFPTTASEGPPMPDESVPQKTPSAEELQQAQQENAQQMLELIQKNRKLSHEQLQRAHERLQTIEDEILASRGDEALFVKKDDQGHIYFSLEDTLRSTVKATGACLTSMEANNSLMDMLINDLGGMVHNIDQTQRNMLIANSHVQTLLELLIKKEIVSEAEMKATWEGLVKQKQEEAKKSQQ